MWTWLQRLAAPQPETLCYQCGVVAYPHGCQVQRRQRQRLRTWQRDTSSLRLLSAAIPLVDAAPELAEMGPDGLPIAWRIFRPGWNESRNGPALFDELAAELVMADYREHGARVQVDKDHVSLDKKSPAYDPRGVGYHSLELRDDGSLWAVAATWTKRGAELLEAEEGKAAELPYYSPAFDVDSDLQFGDEPDRVTFIFNGGLVGTPATDRPMALAAASRQRGQTSMNPKQALKLFRAMAATDRERLLQIWKLSDSQAGLPSAKLAELLKWQDSADDVDPKVLAKMVQAMGGDASQGIGGLMRQLRQFMEMAMKALMGEQPAPDAVPTEAEEAMAADNPEEREQMLAAARRQAEELRQLKTQMAKDGKVLGELQAERDAKQLAIRRQLCGQIITNGTDPNVIWDDPTKPIEERQFVGSFATAPIEELQTWAGRGPSGDRAAMFAPAPRPASGYSGVVTQPGNFQVSDEEEKKLKALARKNGRDPVKAWGRYLDQRNLECSCATGPERRILSRRYSSDYRHPDASRWNIVLPQGFNASDLERFRTWATQAPVEQHSAVSIAAMRTFDETYNMLTAAPRVQWVDVVGDVKPSGTIGDETYVLDFEELFWELKTAQAPGAETPQTWSIDVRKKRYTVAASANLEKLETPGSFDYLTSTWLAKAEKMARSKDRKIAQLAIVILVAPGAWLYERFLDGKLERMTDKRFFAVDHPINVWKPEVDDINGNTTWSNYETTPAPFSPSNLTLQKTQFSLTPNMAGEFLSMPATHVLCPTSLFDEVNAKLTVQDRILALANVGGTDVEGQETNRHIGSGMSPFEIPEMPGVDLTADWMLFSEQRKQAGYVPFLVSVGAERVKIYGPDSHHAKTTDHIREEREVDLRAVPIRPEACRWIVGS